MKSALQKNNQLQLKWLGIDTYREAVIYMHRDCHVCKAEGFESQSRIKVSMGDKYIIATLSHIDNGLLKNNEASLSKYAWKLLDAKEDEIITLSHPRPLKSLSFVREKLYGHALTQDKFQEIITDISLGRYSDIHVATFLSACAGGRLTDKETIYLTQSMINAGKKLSWQNEMIVDKHCVGGLPGNRTTPIVVAIVAAFGLTIPKTSSRAITSPAGTADMMETLAPVNLSLKEMQKVVAKENGCIVWGGSVDLSPADDILIRVERAMDVDSEGQLIASVLSKKIAAGSTHIVIDLPVGKTAKIRSHKIAESYIKAIKTVANALNIHITTIISDGSQPVGNGIGPALEAKDVLSVLQCAENAPNDLRQRALTLAGEILEFSPAIVKGKGIIIAEEILNNGKAWKKFQAICDAQGGIKEPPTAKYSHDVIAHSSGKINLINNRLLAKAAKLAGAPNDKAAGLITHVKLNQIIQQGEPLYTIYAESKGALNYALSWAKEEQSIFEITG